MANYITVENGAVMLHLDNGTSVPFGSGGICADTPYYIPNEEGCDAANKKVYYKWSTAEMYAAWDALMAAYPDYITKTVCSYADTSGEYEMRRYDFVPESGIYDKTIYVQAGAHGSELSGQVSLLRIAQIICEEWTTNKQVAYLRNHVRIVINPIVCPWAHDNGGLCSSTGINVNRNYDGFWIPVTGASYNSGTYPFENKENQWVRDIILDIGADNIWYAFDFHDAGSTSTYGDYWVNFNAFLPEARSNVKQMIKYLCDKNVEGTPDIWHVADTGAYGAFANWTNKTLGIPSSTVESCYDVKTFDAEFMNKAVEVYFNTILVSTMGDYKRPMVMESPYLDLGWYAALGEKEFCNNTNGFNSLPYVLQLFDGLVDDEYVFKSETAVTDSAGKEIHYYELRPSSYKKTIVVMGGTVTVRNIALVFAGIMYKLTKQLKENPYVNEHFANLRSNYRIIMIPTISTNSASNVNNLLEYGSNFSANGTMSTSSTCTVNLKTFLDAIGDMDAFVYGRNKMVEDLADDTTEYFATASEGVDIGAYVEYLNSNGNMTYALSTIESGLGTYLATQNIPSVRIETSLDFADYEAHKNDYPTQEGVEAIGYARYTILNSETARRLSVLVNILESFK